MVTLGVYLVGSGLPRYPAGRQVVLPLRDPVMAGMGIGGEYAAINSAIDEMIPADTAAGWTSRSTAPTGPGHSSAPS